MLLFREAAGALQAREHQPGARIPCPQLAASRFSPGAVQTETAASGHLARTDTKDKHNLTRSLARRIPSISAVINLRANSVLLVESKNHRHFNPNKNIAKMMLDK